MVWIVKSTKYKVSKYDINLGMFLPVVLVVHETIKTEFKANFSGLDKNPLRWHSCNFCCYSNNTVCRIDFYLPVKLFW